MGFKEEKLAWLEEIENNYVTPVINKYDTLITNLEDTPLGQIFLESSEREKIEETKNKLLSDLAEYRQALENFHIEVSREDERFAPIYDMIDRSGIYADFEEAFNKLNEFKSQLKDLL